MRVLTSDVVCWGRAECERRARTLRGLLSVVPAWSWDTVCGPADNAGAHRARAGQAPTRRAALHTRPRYPIPAAKARPSSAGWYTGSACVPRMETGDARASQRAATLQLRRRACAETRCFWLLGPWLRRALRHCNPVHRYLRRAGSRTYCMSRRRRNTKKRAHQFRTSRKVHELMRTDVLKLLMLSGTPLVKEWCIPPPTPIPVEVVHYWNRASGAHLMLRSS
jgi:hypothetical protein